MRRVSQDAAIWGGFWALFAVCVMTGQWPTAATLLLGACFGRVL